MMTSSLKKIYCSIEQTWTITEERLNKCLTPNTSIWSEHKEVAAVPNIAYRLSLYSKVGKDYNDILSLYLQLMNNENARNIRLKYSIFIKSENNCSQYDFVPPGKKRITGWGDDICSIDEFFDSRRKFIVDGKCTIEMKGMLIVEVDELPKMIQMRSNLYIQLLWKTDTKDFTIVVGNEGVVDVHKRFLVSPYFEAMFRSGREEAKTNTLKIIDFRLKTVQLAVDFFYGCHIFDTLDLDDAFELIRFADKFVIDKLEDKLVTFITYRLSPTSICDLVNRSIAANSIKLRQICMDFMMICSRHCIPLDHLDILDKEFAAELFQKTFSSSF